MEQLQPMDTVMAMLMKLPETVRTLKKGEYLPASLEVGLDLLGKLDPDWIWIATRFGLVTGVLAASPCHGVAVIWRVIATEEASQTCVVRLLRAFLKEIRQRGFVGYITILDRHRPEEQQFQSIVQKAGGKYYGEHSLMAAALPRENI